VEAAVKRRRALVVWLVLGGLLAGVAVLEYRDVVASRAAPSAPVDARALLPVPLSDVGAIEIADAGTLHRFERDASGAWFYHGAHGAADAAHTHAADPAAAARIDKAFQVLARARIEREIGRAGPSAAYGLTAPRLLILVYRSGERQPLAQYAVGDVAPDTVSRYVDVVGGAGVVTIPSYQVDNLRELVASMAQPAASRAPAGR
jgi:hypothetical protein